MHSLKRLLVTILVVMLGIIPLAQQVAAKGRAPVFPDIIPLPDGFQPEGVVTGRGPTLYAGSLADGSIYEADLRTGAGTILVPPQDGRVAVGLAFDKRIGYIFVAGGETGQAYVYDSATGAEVASYTLTEPGTFVNDVIVTREAAYFTDSSRPVLYRLPLLPGGRLVGDEAIEEIPLTGDFVFVPGAFNANGIEATQNGKYLILVHTERGELYRVDPDTGEATLIDLQGGAVPSGDGLLFVGNTLYVVQNFLNQIAVVDLDRSYTAGEIEGIITDEAFRIPTTLASFGSSLYAVNARFDVPPAPDTEYEVVRVSRN